MICGVLFVIGCACPSLCTLPPPKSWPMFMTFAEWLSDSRGVFASTVVMALIEWPVPVPSNAPNEPRQFWFTVRSSFTSLADASA